MAQNQANESKEETFDRLDIRLGRVLSAEGSPPPRNRPIGWWWISGSSDAAPAWGASPARPGGAGGQPRLGC
jgi:hypothetical protein